MLCRACPRAVPPASGPVPPVRQGDAGPSVNQCGIDHRRLRSGSIPNFLDEALMPLDAELDDDVDQQVQQALDVAAGQFRPPGFCLTSSTSCSKASSALAACTLVIDPGWPELTLRR